MTADSSDAVDIKIYVQQAASYVHYDEDKFNEVEIFATDVLKLDEQNIYTLPIPYDVLIGENATYSYAYNDTFHETTF